MSPYTGGFEVVTRNYGRWMGVLIFGFLDFSPEDQGVRRDIEAFVAELEGMVNTTDAPIHRPSGGSLGSNRAITFSAMSPGGAERGELVFSSGSAMGAEALVRGDYIRMADRLYVLAADSVSLAGQAGGLMKVRPRVEVVPAVGTPIVWKDVTVRCRASSLKTWENTEATPEFFGPWQMEWVEEV